MSEFNTSSAPRKSGEIVAGEPRNETLKRMLQQGETPLLALETDAMRRKFDAMVKTQKTNGALLAQSMQDSSETWHDNAAAEAISADSQGLSSQANSLINTLNKSTIIDYPPEELDEATLGSLVVVDFGDGDEELLLLTGTTTDIAELSDHEWPETCEAITVKSPLGGALIGARNGEEVKYPVNGRDITVTVSRVHQLSF